MQAAGDRVQALHATKLGLSDQLGLAHTGIADRLEQLLGNEIDLEGDVPLVLLPVRIEVRSTADQTALRVRIFPDTAHAESLEPGLTESEIAAGKVYWDAVWTSGDPAASWPTLQKAVGLRRAPWVAEVLRPVNLTDRPAGSPEYREPDAPARLPSMARTLPDRFLIRIEQDGADPVTVHTRPIPDQVPVGLADVDQLETLKVGDQDLPVMDESLRWLVDYDHAVELRPRRHRAAPGAGSEHRTGRSPSASVRDCPRPTARPGWKGCCGAIASPTEPSSCPRGRRPTTPTPSGRSGAAAPRSVRRRSRPRRPCRPGPTVR